MLCLFFILILNSMEITSKMLQETANVFVFLSVELIILFIVISYLVG